MHQAKRDTCSWKCQLERFKLESLKLESFAEVGKSPAKLERTKLSWKEPIEVGKNRGVSVTHITIDDTVSHITIDDELSNFSHNFPSSFILSNFSQNFPTAAKLSNFSETFQLKKKLSNFGRVFPNSLGSFQLR